MEMKTNMLVANGVISEFNIPEKVETPLEKGFVMYG